MKFNIANPTTGCKKQLEIDDYQKLRAFYDKNISQEVSGDASKTKPSSASGDNLEFCTPNLKDGILQIDEEICEEGAKEWEDKVVGFFLDKKLPYTIVKGAVEKKWNLKGKVEVLLDGDLFYFSFNNLEDRETVLDEGSFHLMGKLFIIKPWSREVEDDRGQISNVPVWVNLFKVPKYLWNNKGLSLIASIIGKPLFTDKNTERKKMLTFARVCVEVDATKELPVSIPVQTANGKSFTIDVEFQWKPLICTKCKVFGHDTSKCGGLEKGRKNVNLDTDWTAAKTKGAKNNQLRDTTKQSTISRDRTQWKKKETVKEGDEQ